MRLKAPYIISVAALAAGVSLALGGDPLSEHGPLPSYTGAPAIHSKPEELNCSFCHLNFDWNNLNTKGGSVKILDLPKTYTAGQTYRFRVRLMTDSTAFFSGRKWGFQLTAVRASDGEGCGTFVLDDPDTLQVVPAEDPSLGSRMYVEHSFMGVREGLGGPVEWTFSWRAPEAPEDTALFYCAGNAANGSFDPSGDFIFTTADTVPDVTTPTIPVSWGEVKRRYR